MPLQSLSGRPPSAIEMRVGKGASMAWNVLHDRQHAARHQPFRRRAAKLDDRARLLAIGARADDVAGALDRHVQHRQAIGRDAVAQQVEGMQPCHQPGGAGAGIMVLAPQCAERATGWIVRRQRRPQALHAAAFLVDEHRAPDARYSQRIWRQI